MQITIVGGPFIPWPQAPCGSVERIWHHMAHDFAKAGHRVTVICKRSDGQPKREILDGVRYHRIGGFMRTGHIKLDLLLDLLFSLRVLLLAPRGDIIVPNMFWLPFLLPRLRPGAGRVVAHVQRFPKGQIGLYNKVDCITTVSQVIADACIEQSPQVARLVRVIPNPVHASTFTPPATPRRFGAKGTILYTGRIHPEKGLHLLVQAFRRLHARWPKLRLRIVGPTEIGRGGGGEQFVATLRELAGDAPVEIGRPINNLPQLAQTLRDASYYCYPTQASKGEASPVAPLEAMATGLTPIVSDIGQFRDYVKPGVNGLVFDCYADNAVDQLTACFEQLIQNPTMAQQMGEQAVRTAASLDYSAIAAMYLNEFAHVLEKGKIYKLFRYPQPTKPVAGTMQGQLAAG